MPSTSLWRRSPRELGLMSLVFVFLLLIVYSVLPEAPPDQKTNFCPQVPAINTTYRTTALQSGSNEFEFSSVDASKGYKFHSSDRFYTDEYRNFSLAALQGAIRIPTVSYDDMDLDPLADPRFDIMRDLHKYLFATFPRSAKFVETVNTYGLLYTFPGTNDSLKPVVLMSHQDVVPVAPETLDQWQYPPFEAHFDGEVLYGRGTSDTKDTLVGLLEASEALLSQNWQPERTFVFAFGFDEEIGGPRGAAEIANKLLSRYGADGVEMVVDEGLAMPSYFGALVGNVGVSEKGYLDIWLTLNTPGGHSSAPPDHTGIGIISQVIKHLEAHPFQPELADCNPALKLYQCLAEHAPHMNAELRRTALQIDYGNHRERLVEHISNDDLQKYMIRSSQAVDVIYGGVKLNALPEQVTVKVNHRINTNSGTAAAIDRFEELVLEIAEKFQLGFYSEGETLIEPTVNGYFNLTAPRKLEPAPISPQVGVQWEWLTGTMRRAVERAPFATEPLIMAPYAMTANTDTRWYWALTRAIYRFKPTLAQDAKDIHTVDERLRFRSHQLTVAFFYDLMLNASQ